MAFSISEYKANSKVGFIFLIILFVVSLGCAGNYYAAADNSGDTHAGLIRFYPNWARSVDGIIGVDCLGLIACIFGIISLSKSFGDMANKIFFLVLSILVICYLILNLVMFTDPGENYVNLLNFYYNNRTLYGKTGQYYANSYKAFYVYQILAFIFTILFGGFTLFSYSKHTSVGDKLLN